MKIEREVSERRAELRVSGRVDTVTAGELEAAASAAAEGKTELVLDLTDVEYVSSAGLRVMMALHKKMQAQAGALTVAHPNESVTDVLKMTKFDRILSVAP